MSVTDAKKQAVDSAVSIAEDITAGRLDPTDLQAEVTAKCRELFGTVYGPEDELWPLHIDVIRQGLHLNALSADELAEWTAVIRRREELAAAPGRSWIERALAEGADDDQ